MQRHELGEDRKRGVRQCGNCGRRRGHLRFDGLCRECQRRLIDRRASNEIQGSSPRRDPHTVEAA